MTVNDFDKEEKDIIVRNVGRTGPLIHRGRKNVD